MTILCYYSCKDCGLQKVPIQIPVRGQEDVVKWMGSTVLRMGLDHNRRSPRCHPSVLSDIMIPMIGADKIGGPSVS